ncbi:MAG: glycosyltransferase [Clostridium sp.]|nr:glycosyltransferase [Clostridium sp.]
MGLNAQSSGYLKNLAESKFGGKMAKVSVLIPVYNVENYIEQCLESVIAQTLKDIEIICVNDGSTDFSLDILKKYAVKDSRIKIINKENGGLPSARNAGLDAATGEYISFVDSDDYVQSNMMSVLYKNAKKTKAEIVICGANVFPETPRADSWFYQALSPERKFYEVCSDELLFENRASRPFIWRIFVKRDLIERNHFRLDENIHIGEDNAFQFRIYPFARIMLSDKISEGARFINLTSFATSTFNGWMNLTGSFYAREGFWRNMMLASTDFIGKDPWVCFDWIRIWEE